MTCDRHGTEEARHQERLILWRQALAMNLVAGLCCFAGLWLWVTMPPAERSLAPRVTAGQMARAAKQWKREHDRPRRAHR